MTSHSQKAMQTLNMMGVDAATAKHADVIFSQEMRNVPCEVTCPVCDGMKFVCKDEAGKVVAPPPSSDFLARQAYRTAAYAALGKGRTGGNCPRCICHNPRARMHGHCTGKVIGMAMRKVWVGTVQWPANTLRDSRFESCETNRYCCGLCSKTLTAERVPVVGTDASGRAHGMWVGSDCARKFLPGVVKYAAPSKNLDVVMEG